VEESSEDDDWDGPYLMRIVKSGSAGVGSDMRGDAGESRAEEKIGLQFLG
jgi:hypothetical protein